MNRIALQMLFGDTSKFVAMIVGITFAALIMTQQPSIFVGLMTRTFAFIEDISLPDIWVMDPSVEFVEENKPLKDTDLQRVRGIEGVAWAVPLYSGIQTVRLPDGTRINGQLVGLDDATMIGAPPRMVEGQVANLRLADSVIVDKDAAERRFAWTRPDGTKGPLQVGDEIEINDQRGIVVGISDNKPNFTRFPLLFTTYSRALSYAPPQRRLLTYVLVKAKEGQDVAELAARIQETTALAALPKEDFKKRTLMYWMRSTGIPINFGVSVILGFLVGTAVAGQTFYSFVRENLKQFAALKAMGVGNLTLLRMTLVQAAVTGFLGYGIGVGLAAWFGLSMKGSQLAFIMPWWILAGSFTAVAIIMLLASAIAVRSVWKLEAAIVFK